MIDDLSDISIELEEFNEKEYPESFTDELNEIANRLLPIDKLTECTRNLDEIEDKNQERIMIIKQFLQYIEMPEFLDVAYETFLDEKEFVGDV